MKLLSKAEEMILLAILRLGNNAYGVAIRKKVREGAGKNYTYGTLYGLLDQLVRKEYVTKAKGEPTHERGGRSKTCYTLTAEGIDALKQAMEMQRLVWRGISDLTLDTGGGD